MKVGDTVRLKSGGPLMTVEKVSDTSATCSWFELCGTSAARFDSSAVDSFPIWGEPKFEHFTPEALKLEPVPVMVINQSVGE